MKNKLHYLLSLSIIVVYGTASYAQGCSDAGFCSIDGVALKSTQHKPTSQANTITAGLTFGEAQYHVAILSPSIQWSRTWTSRVSSSAQLIYGIHSGNLGTTAGLSDLYLSSQILFIQHFKLIAGIKIPLNNANASINDLPLPMAYQTSLGTFDAILGASYQANKFNFNVAWQQPVSQNQNTFLASDYPQGSLKDPFFSTNGYQRAADALLRISYIHPLRNDVFTLLTSIMPVYHIKNDRYKDAFGLEQEINGSKGLTLNLNLGLAIQLNSKSDLNLLIGAPIVSRDARPDGLVSFAIRAEYAYHF